MMPVLFGGLHVLSARNMPKAQFDLMVRKMVVEGELLEADQAVSLPQLSHQNLMMSTGPGEQSGDKAIGKIVDSYRRGFGEYAPVAISYNYDPDNAGTDTPCIRSFTENATERLQTILQEVIGWDQAGKKLN